MDKYFFTMLATALGSPWDWVTTNFQKILGDYWVAIVGAIVAALAGLTVKYWKEIVVKYWNSLVWVHVGYLTGLKEKAQKMRNRMAADLGPLRDVLKEKKDDDFIIPPNGVKWLDDVQNLEQDLHDIPADITSWYNLSNRYGEGKKVAECTKKIDELIERHSNIILNGKKHPLARVKTKKASASTLSTSTYKDFQSREVTFRAVLNAFKDNKIHRIGICGIGGVGKTTMKDDLKTTAKDEHLFDLIIDTTVGRDKNVKDIQGELADQLKDDKLKKEEEGLRADELCKMFEKAGNGKRVLVILDDIWQSTKKEKRVDLKKLGLSSLRPGFKILLTTRDEGVCRLMGVEESGIFRMAPMENQEALKLFQQITCISSNADQVLYEIGEQIVKRCGGLPLAINTIAEALKELGKHKSVWDNMLFELDDDKKLEEYGVFHVLDVSFKFLRDKDAKEIFLLCCLYPEDSDIPVEDLVRYGVGLRLFEDLDWNHVRMERIRVKTDTCIQMLKNVSFLVASDKSECIKVHDLVREFGQNHVLFNTKGEPIAMMVNHGDVSEWQDIESTSESYTSVSLDCNFLGELPDRLNCPNLKLLTLADYNVVWKIPMDFFKGMEKLEVLTFKNMVPLSLEPLQGRANLRSLSLHSTFLDLDGLRIIGSLHNLEVLSFSGSRINHLPEEIGNLSRLRLLDLTGFKNLRIDDNVLPRLQKLEELYMLGDGMQLTDANRSDLIILLEKLTALQFEFGDDTIPMNSVTIKKLKRFKVSVGYDLYNDLDDDDDDEDDWRNTLMLIAGKSELLARDVNVLFGSTEFLHLEVEDLISLEVTFNLDSPRVFGNLKTLVLSSCHQMKNVFSLSTANNLARLETLAIGECNMLEEVVVDQVERREDRIRFPNLKRLALRGLPKLVGFCRSADVVELPQLEELYLEGLAKITSIYPQSSSSAKVDNSTVLPSLFNQQVTITKLKRLEIREMESMMEIWPSQSRIDSVCAPKKLEVESCEKLTNIFPANAISHLHDLEELNVIKCNSLEVVFNLQQGAIDAHDQLQDAQPGVLRGPPPNGDQFLGLRTLRSIHAKNCRSLRHLFKPSIFDTPVQLERLDIQGCKNFVVVDANESFRKSISGKMEGPNIAKELAIDIDPPHYKKNGLLGHIGLGR